MKCTTSHEPKIVEQRENRAEHSFRAVHFLRGRHLQDERDNRGDRSCNRREENRSPTFVFDAGTTTDFRNVGARHHFQNQSDEQPSTGGPSDQQSGRRLACRDQEPNCDADNNGDQLTRMPSQNAGHPVGSVSLGAFRRHDLIGPCRR